MRTLTLALALTLSTPAVADTTDSSSTLAMAAAQGLPGLDGQTVPASALQGKVVLFVNVASRCGYTRQYAGLQELYEAHKDKGLVIVGVPSNQFGGQEPGSAKEIANFCSMNYGVTFPLLEKQDVNGSERSSLYSWLVASEAGQSKDVRWNFEKFLVGRDGQVIERFGSSVAPNDAALTSAIKTALQAGA